MLAFNRRSPLAGDPPSTFDFLLSVFCFLFSTFDFRLFDFLTF